MYMLSLGRACGNARNWYGGEHEYNCTNTDEIVMRYKFAWLCLCFGFALCQRKPLKSTTILIRWWHVATTHASSTTTTDNDNDSFWRGGGGLNCYRSSKLLQVTTLCVSRCQCYLSCRFVHLSAYICMYIFIWPLSLKRFLDSNVGKATVLRLLLLLLLSFFLLSNSDRKNTGMHTHTYIWIYIYITCMHTYLHVYACKMQLPSEMRCPGGPQCKNEQQKQRNKTSISIHRQQQWEAMAAQSQRSAVEITATAHRTWTVEKQWVVHGLTHLQTFVSV